MTQNYKAEGTVFKHEDTTKTIRVRFLLGGRFIIHPNSQCTYVAKIADLNGNPMGAYPTVFEGRDFTVKSADLVGLGPGDYRLEIWEKFFDKDNHQQTAIFPSPESFVTFTIKQNIDDGVWNLTKDISFQDVVNQAVVVSGRNLVISGTQTLPAGSSAQVTQTYKDGQNCFEFAIPKGDPGKDGKSAYQLWLDAGNKGTEKGFLDSLRGQMPHISIGTVTGLPAGSQPSVRVSQTPDGYKLDFNLVNGAKGDKGSDAITPKVGVDYWTDKDKQAIKDEVTKIIGDAKAEAKAEIENDFLNMKY